MNWKAIVLPVDGCRFKYYTRGPGQQRNSSNNKIVAKKALTTKNTKTRNLKNFNSV